MTTEPTIVAEKQPEIVLMLRTCTGEMKSPFPAANGFQWPTFGPVECKDWDPTPNCGNGLHGLAWCSGDANQLKWEQGYKAVVWEADARDVVKIDDQKAKAPRGRVIAVYDNLADAITRICFDPRYPRPNADKAGETASGYGSKAASSGNYSKAASSGNGSTAASSGNYSTAASSGNGSTAASSGNYSKAASSGNGSTAASSGNYSTAASSGNYSKAASSGDGSTAASSGDGSTAASSGDGSKAASSGNYSKAASSGDGSTAASSGNGSTAASSGKAGVAAAIGSEVHGKAGEKGLLVLTYWDAKAERYRAAVGNVGEDIEADTWYCVEAGKLCKVR